MKKLLFFIALISVCMSVYSSVLQEQKIHGKFIILEAVIDGDTVFSAYTYNNPFLVIYETEEGLVSLANVWNDSQSYGSIGFLEHEHIKETPENYKTDSFTFRWDYQNTYDAKKGFCNVKLFKFYTKAAVMFEMKLVTEDMCVMVYKGFMEGTLKPEHLN